MEEPMCRADGYPHVNRISAYMNAQVTEHGIPGMSAAVLQGAQIIHLASYGQANVEWRTSATSDTVYELASLTKPFTASAIMLLTEEGTLDLDGSIAELVPEAPPSWA